VTARIRPYLSFLREYMFLLIVNGKESEIQVSKLLVLLTIGRSALILRFVPSRKEDSTIRLL